MEVTIRKCGSLSGQISQATARARVRAHIIFSLKDAIIRGAVYKIVRVGAHKSRESPHQTYASAHVYVFARMRVHIYTSVHLRPNRTRHPRVHLRPRCVTRFSVFFRNKGPFLGQFVFRAGCLNWKKDEFFLGALPHPALTVTRPSRNPILVQ